MSTSAAGNGLPKFIDLHAHTNESDGSFTPSQLIEAARQSDLAALAITDHDTLAGYQLAEPVAHQAGLDLVCGIELNTRLAESRNRSVHMLAYFLSGPPSALFTNWLEDEKNERRSRNIALARALQARGLRITVQEVEERGRSLAGRPHFASLLVEKGYAASPEEAFERYLGEAAPSFVPRQSKTVSEVIRIVRESGGFPVIAHPIRLNLDRDEERSFLQRWKDDGLLGLEIYHSEHTPELQAYYHQLALLLDLLPTGGSDFHGRIKPDIQLGTGRDGNVRVPLSFLEAIRAHAR